jgi:hypothetical protein
LAIAVLLSLAAAAALSSRAAEPQYDVVRASSRATTDANLQPATLAPLARPQNPAGEEPFPFPPELIGVDLSKQTEADAYAKSRGCIVCHENVKDMHGKATVRLGCCDCHGGNPAADTKECAHVAPRFPGAWPGSAKPVRSYTLLNHESPEFIRFVNPGDLRVAHISCGVCHEREVLEVRKSMMTHGCMLWGAALYNNGSIPTKSPHYGESYSMLGSPQRIQTVPPPNEREIAEKGVVPYLDPLPRFEISQPGNILRIFERGGRFRPEVGIPEREEDPGRPRTRLSNRGLGTENRTDPTFIGLQKTRLFDPTLNFHGTMDHPGDYRSSGCTACHVVYANDRSLVHSGPYAVFGNRGFSFNPDPTIPKNESGHPITHQFAAGNSIPTSQCLVCHIHPGTNVVNSYVGFQWWDEETDGQLMYPAKQRYLTSEEAIQAQMSNPDEASGRGLWSDPQFLANLTDLNTQTRHTQFADFHGHGWVFRAVFKKDRAGNLLDYRGQIVEPVTNEKLQAAVAIPAWLKEPYRNADQKTPAQIHSEESALTAKRDNLPVHLLDIHMEKGMHCIDCHFVQDAHGNARLQREVRAGIEIQCIDCHGSSIARATLTTSGPAAYTSGPDGTRDLTALRTPSGRRRFEREGDRIYQNSMVEPTLRWEVVQTADTIDPRSEHYNVKSAMAKTVRVGDSGKLIWGGQPESRQCAHQNERMSCITCHSSWNPSCFGCHLPQKANKKLPGLHDEGDVSRNFVSYNFQTLRDDVFMLARDGDVTKNRIGPARSSCAIHVGSYNNNRESIYVQQQTISGDGMSGIAFSTNVPHTVRGGPHPADPNFRDDFRPGVTETKMCTDCHVSKQNDNNAIMAQLLMQGTNYVNFIGRYCWVGEGDRGLAAVEVTEREEPQAVIGSALHEMAFPDYFRQHLERGRVLANAHEHSAKDVSDNIAHPFRQPEILGLQLRGEYLYAACGTGGLRVFDVAFIDDKGFSERITTAPVSPIGQRFFVPTKYATAVAAPTTIAPDPTRKHRAENHEQEVNSLYAYLYVVDKFEGLILVGAGTLLDGNPLNNFLDRELTFNPGGILCGARAITIAGTYAYICCDAGLVVVSLEDPKHPFVTRVLGPDVLRNPRAVQVQFRYGFVCDDEGIKVLDTTHLEAPRPIPGAALFLPEARNIYLARTYAYVAGGSQGLLILDITNPERPRIDQIFNAGGCINDLCDVKLGITYTSEFAYLADGCNGLKVVQLTSPETPGNQGFSPHPTPALIASYPIGKGGRALAISKGIDRDRAVDESGNQIGVFGRIGARPLDLEEQRKLYLRPNGTVWKTSDNPWDDEIYDHPPAPLPTPNPPRMPEPLPQPNLQ